MKQNEKSIGASFIKILSDALKQDVTARLRTFKENGRETVIIGKHPYGAMWKERLLKYEIPVLGFCEYKKSIEDGISFDEILQNKYNVCICNIEFDTESEIAVKLYESGIEYVDFTYVVNHRFEHHYNVNLILKKLDCYYAAYDLLEDAISRNVYRDLIKYRITRDPMYLNPSVYPQYFHPIVRPQKGETVIEAGGFDGKSAIQIAEYLNDDGRVISFEPGRKNLESIKENLSKVNLHSIHIVPLGLWNAEGNINFMEDGSASIVSNGGKNSIPVTTIDSYVEKNAIRVDLIKLDVEGSEDEVLEGAKHTIALYQPKLQISVYHKAEDLYALLLKIHAFNPFYKFYLGQHTRFITETVLYAIC